MIMNAAICMTLLFHTFRSYYVFLHDPTHVEVALGIQGCWRVFWGCRCPVGKVCVCMPLPHPHTVGEGREGGGGVRIATLGSPTTLLGLMAERHAECWHNYTPITL